MKKISTFALLLMGIISYAQVGIGTTNPSPSSILQIDSNSKTFVPPRMTNDQMNAINAPLDGSLVFNSTNDALYLKSSTGWQSLNYGSAPAITFKKNSGTLSLNSTNLLPLPLNNTNATNFSPTLYTFVSDGKVKVLASGVFIFNAGISVNNLFAGTVRYSLGLRVNGDLVGYLNRGFVQMPSQDWWGTNGTFVLKINENDVVEFVYQISRFNTSTNAYETTPVNASIVLTSMGITKIQ
ncbi:MAG: hypothetical protein KBS98_01600 [Flavobacterium sp.]|nr:hypothetical protein [Candidatus Neoflavobacterium equi]